MRGMYEILESLHATALTPDQKALVKELANVCGTSVQDMKNEINHLIDLEADGDTIRVDEVRAIIFKAGTDY